MKTSKEVFTRSGGHGPLASVPPPAWFRLLHRVDGGFHFHPHEVGGAAEKDETWAAVRATPFEEEPTALPHPRHRRTLRLSPSQKLDLGSVFLSTKKTSPGVVILVDSRFVRDGRHRS